MKLQKIQKIPKSLTLTLMETKIMNTSTLSNSAPASIRSYQRHLVPRSLVHYLSCNNWTIPQIYYDLFSKYFVRKWQASYFFGATNQGTLIYDDREWLIVFHKTSRGQLMRKVSTNLQTNVTLSFRAAKPEFNLPAYVLVN